MDLDDKQLDKIAWHVVGGLVTGIAGFMALVATVALFGPKLAPLMNYLPW